MVVSFSPSFIVVVVVVVVPPLSRWSSLGECPSLLSLHDDDNGRPSRTSTYVEAATAAASHQHEGDETRGEAAVCGCGYDSENKNSMAVRGGREGDARHPWQTIFVVGHSLGRSVGRSVVERRTEHIYLPLSTYDEEEWEWEWEWVGDFEKMKSTRCP